MNKAIKIIAAAALLAIGVYAAYSVTAEPEMTELQKANLEALAINTITTKNIDQSPLPHISDSNTCEGKGGDCHLELETIAHN